MTPFDVKHEKSYAYARMPTDHLRFDCMLFFTQACSSSFRSEPTRNARHNKCRPNLNLLATRLNMFSFSSQTRING